MSTASMVMMGYSVITQTLMPSQHAFETYPSLLEGKFDLELKHAIYFKLYNNFAPDPIALEQPQILTRLAIVKERARGIVNSVIQEHEAELKTATIESIRLSASEQHPAGTTSEIAAKLGLSKSEVRRMKANGLLDERLALSKSNS